MKFVSGYIPLTF